MGGFLIIDIGTSSIRVTVSGENMTAQDSLSVKRIAPPRFDISAEWQIIADMIRQMTSRGHKITGVAAISLLGWVAVDAQMQPVSYAHTYMDQQNELLEILKEHFDHHQFFNITGRRYSAELGGLKLLRLKKDSPELYQNTACFFSVKDFINSYLTGVCAMDHCMACFTGLWDIRAYAWNKPIADALKIDIDKLPRVVSPGHIIGYITPSASEYLGLPIGIPVVAGVSDGSAGILGAGGIHPKDAVSVMGTTDVFYVITDQPVSDASCNCCINHHPLPGLWMMGGPTGISGGALDWLVSFLGNAYSLAELESLAADLRPGSDGVLFIPSLTGERTPFWQPDVRGSIVGLQPEHHKQHVYRAAMEANGYTIRRISELCVDAGISIEKIIAIGGGAKSDLWLKIKSDITGTCIVTSPILEATTRGGAILTHMALGGELKDIPPLLCFDPIIPNPMTHELYATPYWRYLRLLELLGSWYAEG